MFNTNNYIICSKSFIFVENAVSNYTANTS